MERWHWSSLQSPRVASRLAKRKKWHASRAFAERGMRMEWMDGWMGSWEIIVLGDAIHHIVLQEQIREGG